MSSANEGGHDKAWSAEAPKVAAAIEQEVDALLYNASFATGKFSYDPEKYLSPDKNLEVANYALRDLNRLSDDQEQKVSISKYVAYIAFWFAKLKPITQVYVESNDDRPESFEVRDINERIAILLIDRLLIRILHESPDTEPSAWKKCENALCPKMEPAEGEPRGDRIRKKCYFAKWRSLSEARISQLWNYAAYGLRFRALSPYFLVNYVDMRLSLSCETAFPTLQQLADATEASAG